MEDNSMLRIKSESLRSPRNVRLFALYLENFLTFKHSSVGAGYISGSHGTRSYGFESHDDRNQRVID